MSVLSVNEIHTRRGIVKDDKGVRRATRVWQIATSDPYDEAVVIEASGSIVKRYDAYVTTNATDLNLLVRNIRIQQDTESRLHWTITAEYSDERKTSKDKEANPLLRETDISRSASSYQKIAEVAVDDNIGKSAYGTETAIVNSAGDPFVPPPQVDDTRYTITLAKNFATYDDQTGYDYTNSVNDGTYFGAATRTLKIASIDVPPKITEQVDGIGDVEYYRVTTTMEYRPETWDLSILDKGYNEFISGSTTQTQEISTSTASENGTQPVSEPVLLDGNGAQLAAGGTPSYRQYRYYREKDFDVLGY